MAAIPILDSSELKAHLSLLRAFYDLKTRVESGNKPEFDVHTLSPEERWKSFVQVSVEKFHRWVLSLKVDGSHVAERAECPPLDVCLVWHAYMLNPSRYAKDAKELEALKPLGTLKPRLLDLFSGHSSKGETSPQEPRVGLSFNAVTPYTASSCDAENHPYMASSCDAENCPSPLDLVAAVMRQTGFTEKMVKLGWTEPGFFDNPDNSDTLERCVARYQGFLELMASVPNESFAPTLDIDLAWHTHQLYPERYAVDCMKHAKRFVNHDDNVEETRLLNSFDNTCRAWEERFGMSYSSHHSTKAVFEPANDLSSKGDRSQSARMAPVYLGHEHGLVGGLGVCRTECASCDGP